jgi:hypothetical protein
MLIPFNIQRYPVPFPPLQTNAGECLKCHFWAASTPGYKCLFKTLISVVLDIDPEVGLLGDTLVLLLIFLRNSHTIFHSLCTILTVSPIEHKGTILTVCVFVCFEIAR